VKEIEKEVGMPRFFFLFPVVVLLCGMCFSGCRPQEAGDHPTTAVPREHADQYMVSAADPHAVRAGLEMLGRGGSAVDAAVAVQMVLTFTEPAESSIGGGGFLLHRDGSSGEMTVYDGRETAPQAATAERFLLPGGIGMPFWAAVVSGRSVGVPGVVAMLHLAHEQHGNLPWSELFAPAIEMAEGGIPMPRRLRQQVAMDPSLWLFSDTRRYFSRHLRPWADEPILVNPELGQTMRIIAEAGPDGFYQGELADRIVTAVRSRSLWPGDLTREDLSSYRPEERKPVCGTYRGWTVCSIPPPSSGGLAVLQILGMLEHFRLPEMAPDSLEAVHVFAEASRLAHIDQLELVGDPAFVEIPSEMMLDKDYLADRALLIDPAATRPLVQPGLSPEGPVINRGRARNSAARISNTTHFSIVDGAGNVVAMTSSIEVPFGSRLMAGGFLLNSQLTDFSFHPERNGRPAANAVGPGKRPRSWMSPTIVLDPEGEVRLIIGSRGGAAIVAYVVKTIIGVLDWNLSLQDAIALPNVVARDQDLLLEQDTYLADLAAGLSKMGHNVRLRTLVSGLHGIERTERGWRSGVDPRLGGAAAGK
jgi:gamma-glutamyltranspeptidase / glutathione hydrolase